MWFTDLEAHQHVVLDGALDASTIAALHECALEAGRRNELRAAGVGRGAGAQLARRVRSDQILWLEPDDPTPSVRSYFQRMQGIRTELNRQWFLGIAELEAHFSHYPPGGGYDRHLDRFRDDDARIISSVLYLNPCWKKGDGGELRIFPANADPIDIEPLAGRLILFLSAELEHEVLPTQVDRYSIAGWMRRRGQHP